MKVTEIEAVYFYCFVGFPGSPWFIKEHAHVDHEEMLTHVSSSKASIFLVVKNAIYKRKIETKY